MCWFAGRGADGDFSFLLFFSSRRAALLPLPRCALNFSCASLSQELFSFLLLFDRDREIAAAAADAHCLMCMCSIM